MSARAEAPLPSSDTAERAVDRLRIEPGHSVLDLGCGEGRFASFIEQRRPRLHVGFDIGLGALRLVQRRESGASGSPRRGRQFACGDGMAAPFADGSFDRVVCSLVLYLLPLERAMRELARVVRPGGLAYVRVPMLAWSRLGEVVRSGSLRTGLYGASHVVSGAVYALAGRQVPNPLLRHDAWACYVPRKRFERAVERGGFAVDALEIDWPRPRVPSIEAWLRRIGS